MIWGLLLSLSVAWAGDWKAEHEAIWDVNAQTFVPLSKISGGAGDIIVLGEEHATTDNAQDPQTFIHHDNQLRLIQSLQDLAEAQGLTMSVGMEFLTYTYQSFVDLYLAGGLSEADFLTNAHWDGGNPFDFYRRQILAPATHGGRTIALNIPQDIANQVAMHGKDSLSLADQLLLPPLWERGNDAYYTRFQVAMQGHATAEQMENYFWAQSLWDDTMAWKAISSHLTAPFDVMMIIVGDFHVQFGGGLPYELRKQGAHVKTVLQIVAPDWSEATLKSLVADDPDYGQQADYLWLHAGAVSPN